MCPLTLRNHLVNWNELFDVGTTFATWMIPNVIVLNKFMRKKSTPDTA